MSSITNSVYLFMIMCCVMSSCTSQCTLASDLRDIKKVVEASQQAKP